MFARGYAMGRATGTAGCVSCGSVAGHLAHEMPGAWLLATTACDFGETTALVAEPLGVSDCACTGAWRVCER
jgi:hypothetical protein